MSWHVITREHTKIEGQSSAMWSREAALALACDLIAAGVTVLRIEGRDGQRIDGEEVTEWCARRKNPRRT